MTRIRLPNRRGTTNATACGTPPALATSSTGRFGEVFLQNTKPGSQSDINARDAAIVTSIARDACGVPSFPSREH
jgi:hypothetical protein